MPASVTLTIGIPTFNRRETVARRVREFIESDSLEGVELLVVDNASTDGTYEALVGEFPQADVRILRNQTNLGFAGNFLRIIEETRTDYLTMLSDEDRLNFGSLAELLAFCADRSPRMVSPRAQVGSNECYRGRNTTRLIEPSEFEVAAFYVSGLTFHVPAAREYGSIVAPLLGPNSAANIYPQVMVSSLAVAAGESYFLDALISTQLEQLETHIAEADGSAYFSIPARWAQFVGYEEFFDRNFDELFEMGARLRLETMRDKRREVLSAQLERAAVGEFPALKEHFARAQTAKRNGGFLSRLLRR
jgi:glycosyltransferase involved in cell wall biosynthesis